MQKSYNQQRAATTKTFKSPGSEFKVRRQSLHSSHFNVARGSNIPHERTPAQTTGKAGRRLTQSSNKLSGTDHRQYQLSGRRNSNSNNNEMMHILSASNLKGRSGKSTTDVQASRVPFPQTYLQNLYMVQGNAFKVVQQPKFKRLQSRDQSGGGLNQWSAKEEREEPTLLIMEEAGSRVSRVKQSEIKSMLKKFDQVDSRQERPFKALPKKGMTEETVNLEGNTDQLASTYYWKQDGNEVQHSRRSTQEIDSTMNGSQAPIPIATAPGIQDPTNHNTFVSVRKLIQEKQTPDQPAAPLIPVMVTKTEADQPEVQDKKEQDWRENINQKVLIQRALRNYEIFHNLPKFSTSIEEIRSTQAGLEGWANWSPKEVIQDSLPATAQKEGRFSNTTTSSPNKKDIQIDEEVKVLTLKSIKEGEDGPIGEIEISHTKNSLTEPYQRTYDPDEDPYERARAGTDLGPVRTQEISKQKPMLIQDAQNNAVVVGGTPLLSQTQHRLRALHKPNNRELKSLLNLKEYTQSQSQMNHFDSKLNEILTQNRYDDNISSNKEVPKPAFVHYGDRNRIQTSEQRNGTYNVDMLINDRNIYGGNQSQLLNETGPSFSYCYDKNKKLKAMRDVSNERGIQKPLNKRWMNKFFKRRKISTNVGTQHEVTLSQENERKVGNLTQTTSKKNFEQSMAQRQTDTQLHGEDDTRYDKQSLSTHMKTNKTLNRESKPQLSTQEESATNMTRSHINVVEDTSNIMEHSQANPYMMHSSSREGLNNQGVRSGAGIIPLHMDEMEQVTFMQQRNIPMASDRANLASKSLTFVREQSDKNKRRQIVAPDRQRPISSQLLGPYVHHRKLEDITQDINSVKKFRKVHQIQMEKQIMDEINRSNDRTEEMFERPKTSFVQGNEVDRALLIQEEFNINNKQSTIEINHVRKSGQNLAAMARSPAGAFRRSKMSNKMNIYEKKDRDFQKVYAKTLIELREQQQKQPAITPEDYSVQQSKLSNNATPRIEKTSVEGTAKNDSQAQASAISQEVPLGQQLCIYIDGPANKKIISNRIKILAKTGQFRSFQHKDARCGCNPSGTYQGRLRGQDDDDFHRHQFDPIRMKLRIMPITRAPKGQGKSPDFYFIEASKHSVTNNLTIAIESLHKGLEINPTHLFCRFTHGVLMFKLGLLSQAKFDFELIADYYPREKILKFNHALTLLQLGRYLEALRVLEPLIAQFQKQQEFGRQGQKSRSVSKGATQQFGRKEGLDYELIYDTYMLKAVCLWRLPKDVLYMGEKFPNSLEAAKNLYIAKTRYKDQWTHKVRPVESSAKLQNELKDLVYREMKLDIAENSEIYEALRSKSPKNKDMKYFKHFIKVGSDVQPGQQNSNIIQSPNFASSQQQMHSKTRGKTLQIQERNVNIVKGSVRSVRELSTYYENSETLRDKNGTDTFKGEIDNAVKILDNQGDQTHGDNSPMKLSTAGQQKQMSINSETQNLLKHGSSNQQVSFDDQNSKIRNDQIRIIDQRITMDVINPPTQESLTVEEQAKNASMKFKRAQTTAFPEVIKEVDVQEKDQEIIDLVEDQLNQTEAQELRRKSQMESQIRSSQFDSQMEESKNMEIANMGIEGTNFTQNGGVVEINAYYGELNQKMNELQKKFVDATTEWETERKIEDRKIFQSQLKDEDINEYKRQQMRMSNKKGVNNDEEANAYKSDKLLEKLRESANNKSKQPDEILNFLKTDQEQKDKIKQIQLQMQQNQVKTKRIPQQKLELIKKEFETLTGSKRSIKILDMILGSLKWFSSKDPKLRKLIFEQCEYARIPAHTVIFEQDDEGDKMYVIVKGRIAVEKKSPQEGNMPRVVAICNDGEHFGELGMIDHEKLAKQVQSAGTLMEMSGLEKKQKFDKRKATCIAVEETDLIILGPELSKQVLQPDKKKAQILTVTEGGSVNAETDSSATTKDDLLSAKLKILQRIPIFADIDQRLLVPIACNIKSQFYSYGEFIIKKGEIPPGLIIIIDGQCKVVAERIGKRTLIDNRYGARTNQNQKSAIKLGIKDQVLYDFNPQTSILNQVNSMKNGFQNTRVLIDENSKEIKDKIEYTDYMTFSQLTKGNSFGGRVLVPFDHYSAHKRIYFGPNALDKYYPLGCNRQKIRDEPESDYHMKSLLSVIADTAKVEIWILDKENMNYLDDSEHLKQVYEKIILSKEEDRPYHEQDIQFIIEQFRKWDRYKMDCVETLFERKKLEKYFGGQ